MKKKRKSKPWPARCELTKQLAGAQCKDLEAAPGEVVEWQQFSLQGVKKECFLEAFQYLKTSKLFKDPFEAPGFREIHGFVF